MNKLEKRLTDLPTSIFDFLNRIDELKGQWVGGAQLNPQALGRLKRSTLVTSTGASTRIEGAKMSDEDVEKLMRGLSMQKFADRDKQEVRGYYELLTNVFENYQSIPFSVDGLNRVRRVGEMILFTPCFHRTTLTNPDGEEVLVVDGVIKTIARGGSSKIPENGCVLSIQEKHPLFHTFQEGTPLTFSTQITPLLGAQGEWDSCEYVVGGTPLLLHNGARILDFESEQTILTFLTWRHARTALGLLPNGHWLFVVVDKTGLFDGMTIGELADLMKKLGCVDALNLDGGGSATMVYEGTVKNTPHGDEDEGLGQSCRRVSDAIVILPKTKPFF